mgnify:CR=1 FL=1
MILLSTLKYATYVLYLSTLIIVVGGLNTGLDATHDSAESRIMLSVSYGSRSELAPLRSDGHHKHTDVNPYEGISILHISTDASLTLDRLKSDPSSNIFDD